MRRTEEEIRSNMDRVRLTRPRVWEALELRKKLAVWQTRTSSLSVAEVVSTSPVPGPLLGLTPSVASAPARVDGGLQWRLIKFG